MRPLFSNFDVEERLIVGYCDGRRLSFFIEAEHLDIEWRLTSGFCAAGRIGSRVFIGFIIIGMEVKKTERFADTFLFCHGRYGVGFLTIFWFNFINSIVYNILYSRFL